MSILLIIFCTGSNSGLSVHAANNTEYPSWRPKVLILGRADVRIGSGPVGGEVRESFWNEQGREAVNFFHAHSV